jgi:hypothetical protein
MIYLKGLGHEIEFKSFEKIDMLGLNEHLYRVLSCQEKSLLRFRHCQFSCGKDENVREM